MDLMEKTNERRRTFMKDRLEHKLDDVMRDKARLEEANELLKEEVDRDARERERMLSAFEKGMRPQRSKFRRVMFLGLGVGAAYVYGAKAGRSRYEDIMAWADRMRGRASEQGYRFSGHAQAAADDVANKVERVTATTSDTIEASGRKAANTVRSTTKDATTPDPR
jgi:hypothetical protein